jgi:hypothetical protein
MTTCANCGSPTRDTDRFCARCGADLGAEQSLEPAGAGFCTSCGAPLEADDRFCGRCGAPLAGREPRPLEAQDLLADWDLEVPDDEDLPLPAAGDREAITEAIPRPAPPPDTAIIERQPELPAPPVPARPVPLGPGSEGDRTERAVSGGFPLGATVALLGAISVIVSAILEWNGPFGPDRPRDIAARLLFDPSGPPTGPNLGFVLLVVGTTGALVAILTMAVPVLKPLRRLMGLVALAIPAGFAVRTFQLALEDGALLDLPALLGPGVYVALAGGFVEMVAGKWFRR